jgi:hypothetical protein
LEQWVSLLLRSTIGMTSSLDDVDDNDAPLLLFVIQRRLLLHDKFTDRCRYPFAITPTRRIDTSARIHANHQYYERLNQRRRLAKRIEQKQYDA